MSDTTPKPLLEVAGRALIEHHLVRLVAAGHRACVINLSWLGAMIRARLGDGARYGATIAYSDEGPEPLETAGGIVHALPLLGDAPFAVVNADIWTDYDFGRLALPAGRCAHLVLVPNPAHNAAGDFRLGADGEVRYRESGLASQKTFTFAGIAVYAPTLFTELAPGKRPLAPLLRDAADSGKVSGEIFEGVWDDVGTPERLTALRERQKPGSE